MQGFKEFTGNRSHGVAIICRGLMADDKKAKKDDSKDKELKANAAGGKADAAAAGAEGDALPEGEGAEAKPGFSKKKIALFTLIPLLVLIGAGVGAWQMGYLDKFLHKKIDCTTVAEGDKDYEACAEQMAQAGQDQPGLFMTIPDMIVNLNSTSKTPRFLKVALKVELADKTAEKAFENVMPRVIDQFQTYMRELRLEDLRGSSGMYRMKIELLSRVRAAAPDIKVRDVLFQEIIVQ